MNAPTSLSDISFVVDNKALGPDALEGMTLADLDDHKVLINGESLILRPDSDLPGCIEYSVGTLRGPRTSLQPESKVTDLLRDLVEPRHEQKDYDERYV